MVDLVDQVYYRLYTSYCFYTVFKKMAVFYTWIGRVNRSFFMKLFSQNSTIQRMRIQIK